MMAPSTIRYSGCQRVKKVKRIVNIVKAYAATPWLICKAISHAYESTSPIAKAAAAY